MLQLFSIVPYFFAGSSLNDIQIYTSTVQQLTDCALSTDDACPALQDMWWYSACIKCTLLLCLRTNGTYP